jgi:hypothetical protein
MRAGRTRTVGVRLMTARCNTNLSGPRRPLLPDTLQAQGCAPMTEIESRSASATSSPSTVLTTASGVSSRHRRVGRSRVRRGRSARGLRTTLDQAHQRGTSVLWRGPMYMEVYANGCDRFAGRGFEVTRLA